MSQENVETVRQALRAFDRSLEEVGAFWDPEIDWRAIEGAPDDIGVFQGRDAGRDLDAVDSCQNREANEYGYGRES
jgi:ketosteroid isomerase-like protein